MATRRCPNCSATLTRYLYTGNAAERRRREVFLGPSRLHHSYATGGHGHDEYFGEPDKLNNRVDGRNDESCNVYNMLKLSRDSFSRCNRTRYRGIRGAGAVQSRARLD